MFRRLEGFSLVGGTLHHAARDSLYVKSSPANALAESQSAKFLWRPDVLLVVTRGKS